MLTKQQKAKIVSAHKQSDNDTGSAPVTVGLLTKRITELSDHLRIHKKDTHSRRGLIGLVAKRRKMLNYLKKKDAPAYQDTISKLGLKR